MTCDFVGLICSGEVIIPLHKCSVWVQILFILESLLLLPLSLLCTICLLFTNSLDNVSQKNIIKASSYSDTEGSEIKASLVNVRDDSSQLQYRHDEKPVEQWVPQLIRFCITYFTVPLNRAISSTFSKLAFMILILFFDDHQHNIEHFMFNWRDQVLLVFTVALLCEDLLEMRLFWLQKQISVTYDFVFHVCFLLGLILTQLESGSDDHPTAEALQDITQTHNQWWSPSIYGHSLIGIGAILGTLKGLSYLYMKRGFGTVILAIKKTIKDLLQVSLPYFVFLFSFSVGMFYVMKPSADKRCKYNSQTSNDSLTPFDGENNRFRDLEDSFFFSLWSFFDPGKPGVAIGCATGVPRHLGTYLC